MKAVAVYPGQSNSVHLEEVPRPTVDQVENGRGVLVKVLKVGVDATDREINDALYGNAPGGDKHLVTRSRIALASCEQVGPNVKRDFNRATT
jgi:glucose 1-dehydrogenase